MFDGPVLRSAPLLNRAAVLPPTYGCYCFDPADVCPSDLTSQTLTPFRRHQRRLQAALLVAPGVQFRSFPPALTLTIVELKLSFSDPLATLLLFCALVTSLRRFSDPL